MSPSPQNQKDQELQIRRLLDEADRKEIRDAEKNSSQWRRRPWLWPIAFGHWLATEFQFGDLPYRKSQGFPLPKTTPPEDTVARMRKAIASEKTREPLGGSSRKD